MPAGLEYISAFPVPDQVTTLADGRTSVEWPVEALTSGSKQYSFKAKVRSTASLGEQLINFAGISYNAAQSSDVALRAM